MLISLLSPVSIHLKTLRVVTIVERTLICSTVPYGRHPMNVARTDDSEHDMSYANYPVGILSSTITME